MTGDVECDIIYNDNDKSLSILLGEKYDNSFKAIPHYHLIDINANGIVQDEFLSICLHACIKSKLAF